MSDESKSYKVLPIGGLIPKAGSSHDYNTGTWRSSRPVHNKDNCINCLFCWIYCPDSSVIVEDEKFSHFDYDHCKGCGICQFECPTKVKAITMESEDKYR